MTTIWTTPLSINQSSFNIKIIKDCEIAEIILTKNYGPYVNHNFWPQLFQLCSLPLNIYIEFLSDTGKIVRPIDDVIIFTGDDVIGVQ